MCSSSARQYGTRIRHLRSRSIRSTCVLSTEYLFPPGCVVLALDLIHTGAHGGQLLIVI